MRVVVACLVIIARPNIEDATTWKGPSPTCKIIFGPNAVDRCRPPQFDMVATVIEELKDEANVDLFNSLALCYTRGLYCELIPDDISEENIQYSIELGTNLSTITRTWDMKGEMVENFTQVTELAAHLLQIDVYRGLVDFGYDKGFSVDNPKSDYSRGIVWWGGPLSDRDTLTTEQKEEADETDEEQRKE